MRTIRPASATAIGRNHIASITLKIAEFAPIPKASDNAATNVKVGRDARMRTAKRRSRNILLGRIQIDSVPQIFADSGHDCGEPDRSPRKALALLIQASLSASGYYCADSA